MTTPQAFGDYLLFRKLSTDALGDTYRAGKRGPQGIDRVVLLRQFGGAGIDRAALATTLGERRGIHQALQNPHLGEGVDAGRIGEMPFASWEYISGKNLRELLAETVERSFPLPIEHALFIAERMTFGLSAAYATRHHDSRVHHGFLVPELVELSNEGEVRVLGFEAGLGLRRSLEAPGLRQAFGRYLAPEVGPGTPPSSAEDVFSLGAILFEMLTGRALVSPPDGDYEMLIDQATVAADESPLPPSIRALLKSSLARREERIADVQQWQQALSRFIAEGPHNPTSFNLAFFMHSLFRGDIERETEELEQERRVHADVEGLTTPVEAEVADDEPRPSAAVLVPPGVPHAAAADGGHYGKAGRKRGGLVAAAVGLVVLGGLGTAYFVSTGANDAAEAPEEGAAEVVTAPAATPVDPLDLDTPLTLDSLTTEAGDAAAPETAEAAAPPAGAAPEELVAEAIQDLELDSQPPGNLARRRPEQRAAAAPSPDEMQDQIRRLVEARAQEMEGTLQQRYEEQLEELRRQLDEAQRVQQEQEAAAEEAARQQAAEEEAAAQAAAAAPTETASTGAAQPVDLPQAEVTRTAEGPVTQTITPTPEPDPVEAGQLVEPGPGVTPPRIVDRPRPRYPPSARRLGKVATVQLRVLVDENGRVLETQQIGGRVGFGFDQEALAAARETTWRPAMKSGVPVRMWIDLRIEFRP